MPSRVLIVDDNQAMNRLLVRFLEGNGYEAAAVSDSRRAIDEFEALEPDLVLLDLNMPYVSGWELCRMIKAQCSVPVIIFSVRDQQEDIARGFAAGADDYLIKPFEFPDLLQRVQRLLEAGKPG